MIKILNADIGFAEIHQPLRLFQNLAILLCKLGHAYRSYDILDKIFCWYNYVDKEWRIVGC